MPASRIANRIANRAIAGRLRGSIFYLGPVGLGQPGIVEMQGCLKRESAGKKFDLWSMLRRHGFRVLDHD